MEAPRPAGGNTTGTPTPDKGITSAPHESRSSTPPDHPLFPGLPADLTGDPQAVAYSHYQALVSRGVSRADALRIADRLAAAPTPVARPAAPVHRPAGSSLPTDRTSDITEKAFAQEIARATGTSVRVVHQVKVSHGRRRRLKDALDNGQDYPEDVAANGVGRAEAAVYNERFDDRNNANLPGQEFEEKGEALRLFTKKRFPNSETGA